MYREAVLEPSIRSGNVASLATPEPSSICKDLPVSVAPFQSRQFAAYLPLSVILVCSLCEIVCHINHAFGR